MSPVDPEVSEAKCELGVVNPPTLTTANTDKITYSVAPAGPYSPGQTVIVTATLAQGFAWPPDLGNWVATSPTQAAITVKFQDASCIETSPATPTITAATCTGGA